MDILFVIAILFKKFFEKYKNKNETLTIIKYNCLIRVKNLFHILS